MQTHRASSRCALTVVFFLAATAPGSAQVDLLVDAIDTSGVIADDQTLAVGGTVGVTTRNAGASPAVAAFDVVVFEDVNLNDTLDAGTDVVLGSTSVPGLGGGASTTSMIPVSGMIAFRDNRIHAVVDAGGVIPESDESNNVFNTGLDCLLLPVPGMIDPVLEWSWTSSSTEPNALNVMMTPSVVDLNGDTIPEVVFASTASTGGGQVEIGFLRALNGATGAEVFTVTDPTLRVNTASSIATGDVDQDGMPEIVACDDTGARLIVFEHDGTFKWRSGPLEGINWGAPSIADLDGDGSPEIVIGRQALDAAGNLLWTGTGGLGQQGSTGPLSCVADIDLDGSPEVIAGNTAYNADGTIQWIASTQPDGYNAIANFDADPFAEIVLVSGGTIRILDHDGTLLVPPVAIPGGGAGGPPTVANYDADVAREIGVAGASSYAVYEANLALKWSSPTQDGSSNRTGSSVFDFDGDGAAEVVYRDELFLRIYEGATGIVLFQTPMSSCTWHEYVLVADVDMDGNAEIVAVANNNCGFGPQRGVFAFGSLSDSWVPTRPIWNQHTYHITNVADDGSIPAVEANNWLTPIADPLNNYRQNLLFGQSPLSAPDLTASHVKVTSTTPNVTIQARIGNGGSVLVAAGSPVAFYDGDPNVAGALLGVAFTTIALVPGTYEDVVLSGLAAVPAEAYASADDAGGLTGLANECDETNNVHGVRLTAPTITGPVCGTTVAASVGIPVTFSLTAQDVDPGDFVVVSVNGLPAGATTVPALPQSGNPIGVTFQWTPSNGAVGNHIVQFRAVDTTCLEATCTVVIAVAECYLFLGNEIDNKSVGPGDLLYVKPLLFWPVTIETVPSFPIPNDASLNGVTVYSQVLMLNESIFPQDPLQASNGLKITIGQPAVPYGANSGLTHWAAWPPMPGGTLVLKFSIGG